MAKAIDQRKTRVIDLDLRAYFDNVQHYLLLEKMARRVQDDGVMRLLKMILKATGKKGVPQGGVVSAILQPSYLLRPRGNKLCRDVVVHPVTLEVAQLAGKIEGDQAAHGVSIAFEDLLIVTTALHLGYAVATLNVRHFRLIPELSVLQL